MICDFPEAITAAELRWICWFIDEGKLKEGDLVTPLLLKQLLDCTHEGPRACQACLPDPERADGKVPKAAP